MKRLANSIDFCLIVIVCLSLALNLWGIWRIDIPNSYYMAATVSMVQNFHNFFFASFDPAGFVSIDKPPLDFWIQAVSALIFGIHGWSVILPQALAETGSVFVIYYLVRPSFGVVSARIASLLMAITPVAVAVSRTNNVDSLLVLVLLIGTLFLFKSVGDGKKKNLSLMLAFVFVGLGFNIKMLEAYMIVPAFIIFYLIVSNEKWRKKISKLFLAICIMTVVSLAWALTVDSIAKEARPYVGSSMSNSVTELAFGYNGTQRLMGQSTGLSGSESVGSVQSPKLSAGLTRLIRVGYGTQISWFLPFTLFSIPAVLLFLRKKKPKSWYKEKMGREALFWITFFIPVFLVFSFAGFFHRYYFIMLAPSIAVLCGIGWSVMYQSYKNHEGLRPYVFPFSLLVTLALQVIYVGYYNLIAGLLLAIGGLLIFSYFGFRHMGMPPRHLKLRNRFFVRASLLIILSISPFYWSLTPVLFGGNYALPEAGPQLENPIQALEAANVQTDRHLIHYLSTHQTSNTFLFGTIDAPSAAPYIIKTGKPVMAIGGFNGTDPIIGAKQLEQLVQKGRIHYFYLPATNPSSHLWITSWLRTHGRLIETNQWEGSSAATNKSTGQYALQKNNIGQLYELNTRYFSQNMNGH